MNKYTIIKAFERQFPFKIWKITADAAGKFIGLEIRDSDSTKPIIYVLDFNGKIHVKHLKIEEKEWTLEAIRPNSIVLKRVGNSSPIGEGVQILDFQGNKRYFSDQHVWLDTYLDFLKIRHRSFQSGMEELIKISNAEKMSHTDLNYQTYCTAIKLPLVCLGEKPAYLENVTMEGSLMLSKTTKNYLWSYHSKEGEVYQLNLCIADRFKVSKELVLLTEMEKMVPQPYFQISDQIFLMSYNKQEIVSYLV